MTRTRDESDPVTPPRPRRAYGAGSIEERPNGKFRVQMRDPTRPGKRMPGRHFATYPEADQYRRGLLGVLASMDADGTLPEPDSLQRFAEAWLDEQEQLGDLRGMDTFRSQWDCHLSGTPLATMTVAAITEADVRVWLSGMLTKPALATKGGGKASTGRKLSRDTISKVLSELRQILEAARAKGLCHTNAARSVHVKGRRVRGNEVGTFLQLGEIDRLEACAEIPEPNRLVYLVAVYTGLREGELWGLHWRDVHLDGERPQVAVRFSHKGPPKNGKVRHVPLIGPARALLRRWKEIATPSKEDLVFPTSRGGRRGRSDDARWADYWLVKVRKADDGTRVRENVRQEGYSKRLQLGRPVRFHDLRHTCASHLIMGTWGIQWTLSEIAAFLGHSDTEVTERYAHLSPDHLHDKAAKTGGSGGSGTGSTGGSGAGSGDILNVPTDPLNPSKTTCAPGKGRTSNPQIRRGEVDPATTPTWALNGDVSGTLLRGVALRVLAEASAGQLAEATIQALALAVLDQPQARHALDLVQGDPTAPHRVRRALELAVMVVGATDSVRGADNADNADNG